MASLFGKGKSPARGEMKPASMPRMPEPHKMPANNGGGHETKITHDPATGGHEVHHSDGEVSKHPNAGHMAAHLHAKHAGGEVGNMHTDDMGKTTTHSVGPDGEVSGPNEHASPQEGGDHLAQMMSGEDQNEVPGYDEGHEGAPHEFGGM